MNKKRKNWKFFRCNFFPKNNRGQFFLIMAFIILGLVAGLATMTNSVDKKVDARFNYVKDELGLESEKVIDYSINNNRDIKADLTAFSQDYSTYSNADDFYYIFGTTSEITFAGCKKKTSGQATIEDNLGAVSTLTINQGPCNLIQSNTLTSPPTSIILKVNNVKYPFTLRTGQNFYFVVSKDMEGDVYIATNS